MDQVKLVEDSPKKIWSDMVCLDRPEPIISNFLKGCLPKILQSPFLNSLTYIFSDVAFY